MQIEIDFEVFKELTAKRASEAHSYNDVLRDLLNLPLMVREPKSSPDAVGDGKSGRLVGGRFLPADTKLRAKYKSHIYTASIIGNELVIESGQKFRTASAAAKFITDTNINGLTFWEVMRPQDSDWRMIKALPKAAA